MFVQAFPSGPFLTNAYIAACTETGEAVVIDPAPGSFSILSPLLKDRRLNLQKILLTHSHWDHIADIKLFQDNYHIPVYVHRLDAPNLLQPGSDGLPCWVSLSSIQPDVLLEDQVEVIVGKQSLCVLHTPGHSPGSICFYIPKAHILFSGDTLFHGSIGNLSFPTSQPDLMWPSLARLAKLPPETRFFPGHGSSATLAEESSWLPFAKNMFDH